MSWRTGGPALLCIVTVIGVGAATSPVATAELNVAVTPERVSDRQRMSVYPLVGIAQQHAAAENGYEALSHLPWLLITVSFVAGWLGGATRAAEKERERATERLQTVTRTFIEQIEGLRHAVLGAYLSEQGERDEERIASAEIGRTRFDRAVNDLFSLARRATAAAGDPPSLWQQVRAILRRRLGRTDVDEITLGEAGGTDPGVRQRIASDISRQWPDLKPEWTTADVTPDSTLASLVNEIDGRTL